jgi:tetratricopeptide (TPR) repeat protein
MSKDLKIEIKEPKDKTSKEISDLYQVFSKIRIAMRFEDKDFSTNSAELLITFSQALQLFEEFKNARGLRICSSKIGEIHLSEGRFEEAMEYFRRARMQAEATLTASKEAVESGQISEKEHAVNVDVFRSCSNQLVETMLEVGNSDLQEAVFYLQNGLERGSLGAKMQFQVDSCLLLALAYTRLGQLEASQLALERAHILLNQPDEPLFPVELLTQKALFVRGCIAEAMGNDLEAGQIYTNFLLSCERYDPKVRKQCFCRLKGLFARYNMESLELNALIGEQKVREKEVIFLLDYSQGMQKAGIERIIAHLAVVFNANLRDFDYSALILCANAVKLGYSLTPKAQNTEFLRQNIAKWSSPLDSPYICLYDSLLQGISQLSRKREGLELLTFKAELIREEAFSSAKWVLMVTTGCDNCSEHSFEQVISALR